MVNPAEARAKPAPMARAALQRVRGQKHQARTGEAGDAEGGKRGLDAGALLRGTREGILFLFSETQFREIKAGMPDSA